MPLTAAEILEHPEFKNVTWDLKPTKSGKAEVAKGRGGPFKLSYWVHGKGDICLVWIMGLGAFGTAWQRQTVDFGHTEPNVSKYSSLVFDNRGMGQSDKPTMRYTTSEMAKDTIDLVDHLGWTKKRQLHIVGVSMGGMIAQEIAYLIPDRIASLCLVSTAARLVNTVGFVENLRQRINLFIPKEINVQLSEIKVRLFSQEFVNAPDADASSPYVNHPFPTNGDRFAAQEVAKRRDTEGFTRKGFILQAIAAGWHHKSKKQLEQIGETVGRERICVMHGTLDQMITFPHGPVLAEELGVELTRWDGVGHVVMMEKRKEFAAKVEGMVQKGIELNNAGG